ncbi:inner nuclear membrane protein Man1-like [Lethenteron reissneri]|uniref:inner nuclear membrane protein Man1-like n=1 Tax=Lethenteron reissneri TaxID=7753 RepID=UPI002AB5E98C|nr:inner nuclear membrane protein Man1-like [Lethenteron reissneri]
MGTRSGGRRSAASMGAELSDADLRARLLELGQSVGPVTATTRGVMLRKLAALEAGSAKAKSSTTTSTTSSSSKVIRARGGGAGNRRVDAFMFSSDSDDDDGGGGGGGGGDRGGIGVAGRGGEGRLPAPKRTSLGVGFVAGRPRPQDGAVRTREVGTDPRKKAAFRQQQQQQEATAAYSDDDVVYARGGGGHVDGAAEEEEEEEEEEEMDTRDDVYSRTAPVSGLGLFQSEFARHLEAGGGRPMPTKPIAASSSPYGNGRRSGLDIGYPSSSYYSSSSKSYSSTAAGAAPSRDLIAGFDTSSRIGSSSSRIGSRYSSGDSGGLRSNPIASSSSSGLSLRHGALGGGDDGARGGIGGGGEQRSSAPQELDRPRRSRFPELSSGRSDATGIDAATWSGYFPSTSGWFSSRGGGADGGVGGGGGGSGGGGAGSSSAGTAGSRDVPFAPSSSSQLYSRKNFASHSERDGDSGLGGGSSFKLGLGRAEVGNFDSYLRGGGGEGRVEAKREPLVSSAALRKRGGGTTAKTRAVDKTPAADSFYVRYKSNLLRIGLGMLLVWMAIIYLLTCGENSDEFKAPCETTECEKRGVDEICGKMHSLLAIRAGERDCGYLKGQKAELPVEKVKEDPEIKSYDETVFHKALDAIVKNEARFGIKVRGLDANVKVVNASDVKFLESIHLQRSFVCRLRNAVVQTVVRLLIIFLAIAVLWGLYLYAKLWLKQKGERKKQVFELVEKISELVQQQMLDSQTNWRVQPFLPIPHVRDSLIKPQDRDRMRPVWEQAVQFIDAGESRIRTENQLLHGQDCEVWRWTSLPTSPGSSPAASP